MWRKSELWKLWAVLWVVKRIVECRNITVVRNKKDTNYQGSNVLKIRGIFHMLWRLTSVKSDFFNFFDKNFIIEESDWYSDYYLVKLRVYYQGNKIIQYWIIITKNRVQGVNWITSTKCFFVHWFRVEFEFWVLGFEEEAAEKNLQSKDEIQQQTQPSCDVRFGNKTPFIGRHELSPFCQPNSPSLDHPCSL